MVCLTAAGQRLIKEEVIPGLQAMEEQIAAMQRIIGNGLGSRQPSESIKNLDYNFRNLLFVPSYLNYLKNLGKMI